MARHALLVGVSRFKDSRLNTLNAPANDVEAFAAILRDPARGGFDGVKVSLDPDFLTFRDNLSALFNKRDPDDLLLLYYSGHGILRSDNRLYLATIETDFEQPEARGVAASEIREAMDRTRAERQVLVLDCCHSGAFAPGAKGAGATAVTSDTFGSGSYVLTASDAQQFAWDGDCLASGNAATRTLSHFTSWLVDGLGRGDAAPDDPDISMDALFRYICRRAKAAGSPATPQRFVERGSEDLIIGRNPAAAGAASVQALAGQLGNADWTVRLAAAAALGKLASKSASRDAARDALADRLGAERDFKVRGALLRGLELPSEAAPHEPEAPPPEPPLEGAKPHADPVTLSPAQGGRVALEARALRNARWLMWAAWGSLALDVGAVQNLVEQHDTTAIYLAVGQFMGAAIGLLQTYISKPVSAALGIRSAISVIRSGFVVYEAAKLRRACWIMMVAGLVTLGGMYLIQQGS